MAINLTHLLNYPIPVQRQRYTRADMALYGLSVGAGQDPLAENLLAYCVAERPDFKAVPSAAVVLGHPGFWLGAADTGVNAVKLVHGEQGIVWHQPLPPEGELIGTTRVSQIVDKGLGKGALLYSEKTLTDAQTGALLATTYGTTFLRGDGGFGGPAGPIKAPHEMPKTPPLQRYLVETRPEQALYYRLNGDGNPLHADPQVAAAAGFSQPILHGLCTLGVVLLPLLGHFLQHQSDRLGSLTVRFVQPVYPGETLAVDVWADGSFQATALARDLVVLNHGHIGFTAAAQSVGQTGTAG
ncbi:MAG: MaoC family dehydratase N-terminal domain-containing protein [Neisseriaceae bacterium]|nr:MaoC family dehydratase N-terminal domain-containing protein [Neisseriaceae bacterium]